MWFLRKKPALSMMPVWATAAVVLLVKALLILVTPMRSIASTTWLIDDSFIEMRVARNIGLGFGFSLDTIHLSTGAPFSWMYLTALNHLILPTKDAAIRATLIESSLFGALATVLVFAIAWQLTRDRRVAWTAFLLSTFTGNAFLNAMNGMETSFFTFLVLLSIAVYLGIGRSKQWSPLAWGCVIGLAAGLTTMTRGDGLFVLIALVCTKLYEWYVASPKERKEHVQSLIGLLVVAAVCFGIFMTWQLVQTGSPFPGNQVGRRGLSLALHNFSFDAFSWPRYLSIVGWNVFQLEEILSIATGSSLLMLTAFVCGSFRKEFRALSIFTGISLGIFFGLLVAYQWYFADVHGLRYVNTAAHILFIYTAFLLWKLPMTAKQEQHPSAGAVVGWRSFAAIFLSVCIAILASYKHYQIHSRLPWAKYMSYIGRPAGENFEKFWGTLDWMNANLPPETIVGIRDYGRASMFTNVLIQDLAGNIDPDVAVALDYGTLKDYLKQRNVEYLLIPTLEQRPDKLYQYIHKNLRLVLVPGAPQSPPAQNLYKIIW